MCLVKGSAIIFVLDEKITLFCQPRNLICFDEMRVLTQIDLLNTKHYKQRKQKGKIRAIKLFKRMPKL